MASAAEHKEPSAESDERRAQKDAALDRRVRRVFGDKLVDEWRRILRAHGLWRD